MLVQGALLSLDHIERLTLHSNILAVVKAHPQLSHIINMMACTLGQSVEREISSFADFVIQHILAEKKDELHLKIIAEKLMLRGLTGTDVVDQVEQLVTQVTRASVKLSVDCKNLGLHVEVDKVRVRGMPEPRFCHLADCAFARL
jgi:hypothetical protein